MFMKFTESSSPDFPPPLGYPILGGSTVQEAPKWVQVVEKILFCGEVALNIFIVLLNVTVFLVLWRATKPEYKACFYIIMRTFTCFVALNALGTLITTMNRQDANLAECWWIQGVVLVNMFTCIASSLWLFYAGFNRMMVLVWPDKMSGVWSCWIVRGTLTSASILALIFSFLYQKMCGMYTRYDVASNTVQVVASSMAEPITIAVYVFPLFSLVFYAAAYNNLRQKRLLVTSDKTKLILDKAERKTLKIGMIIMVTYTTSLMAHVFLLWFCTNETFSAIYNRLDEIVSTAPQVALPLALLSCNTKLFHLRRSSSVVSQTDTVQGLYKKNSFMSEKRTSEAKMSTSSH